MAETSGGGRKRPAKDDQNVAGMTAAQWTKVGVAMGIGSAGLVAALLYANRDRKAAEEKAKARLARATDSD